MAIEYWEEYDKYPEGMIKEYKYWTLEIAYRQHTLGSYMIFAKRKVEKISNLTNAELLGLKEVMNEIEEVLLKNEPFKPERFNYLQLGNSLHQLHFHCIPRYSSKRTYLGIEWIDPSFGTLPTWAKEDKNMEIIMKIKNRIVGLLEK